MPKLTQDVKLYAKLLLSVGRQGRDIHQKRPLSPIECAHLIQRLMDEEDENLAQVVERLDMGRPKTNSSIYKKRDVTQVREFINLLKFSPKSRYFAGWGWEGPPKVAFSVMTQLSSLSHQDQDKILQSMYNDDQKRIIDKSQAKKINTLKKNNSELNIEKCITDVLKLKPVKTTSHIIVCETNSKLKHFIQSNDDYRKRILDILRNNLNGEFYSVDATDILISISMNEVAYKTFHDKQYKKNITFTQFLNNFLEDQIE